MGQKSQETLDRNSAANGTINKTTGLFSLASTPAGYDVCGGFLPSGAVLGLVACKQDNYLPAVFKTTQAP